MDGYIISGIQQIGVGVPDVQTAWAWLRKHFGMDIPIFQDAAEAPFMTPYTGGTVQSRTATLAVNLMGGGGFEIWQYTSRTPEKASFDVQLGDCGIFITRVKTPDVQAAYDFLKGEKAECLGDISTDPAGTKHFFVIDSYKNIYQVTEGEEFFTKKPHKTGAVAGCLIGVSDIDKALPVYSDILGYDTIEYDKTDVFSDFAGLPGGDQKVRRMLLSHSEMRKGAFSRLLGPTKIELVETLNRKPEKIFKDRLWGDLGFIHLCFDVRGMKALEKKCADSGAPFTVHTGEAFDMGDAAGPFAYIEDPDGTLIEFVEVHKMPINKAKGKFLDLTKRDPEKPLSNMMLKALRFGRVKE